jgi:HSP20 family protein
MAEIDAQTVPVNMYETDGAIVIVAALPGVMGEDVDVTIEDSSATIRAALRTAAPKDYLLHEWHYGPYERSVDLPDGFGGAAEATFANGQLALRIERGDATGTRTAKVSQK